MPTTDGVARARVLLEGAVLVDGHNDLPWQLRERAAGDPGAIDLAALQPSLHTDLPRLRRGRVGAQFWSVYVPCSLPGDSAVTAVLEQVELVHAMAARYPEQLQIATTAAEAEAAFAAGRVASLIGAEGGHCIAESLGALRAIYRLGVRYLTLTHNDNTPWADSATDEPRSGGLSDFGREVVREMNRLGMLVDLSHVAASTMRDALATSVAPVIFSHSGCRAVTDHPRNVPDDVLAKLPANGGVCMLTFVPSFVSPELAALRLDMKRDGLDYYDDDAKAAAMVRLGRDPATHVSTLAQVVDHIEHAREVAGIDHIGLGGDFDGVKDLSVGLEDVSCYPALIGALLDRGWSEEDCAKLAGRNVLRALAEAEQVAARLQL